MRSRWGNFVYSAQRRGGCRVISLLSMSSSWALLSGVQWWNVLRLHKGKIRVDNTKNFFTERVAKEWNKLLKSLVMVPRLQLVFKRFLNDAQLHALYFFMCFNFKVALCEGRMWNQWSSWVPPNSRCSRNLWFWVPGLSGTELSFFGYLSF